MEANEFVLLVVVLLVMIVFYQMDRAAVLKDRVDTLERQMRELHKIVVANLPEEE